MVESNYAEAYREEAQDLLAELEISLLELEENPGDMDLVGRVFRSMHTIKGSGAMFGFEDIARFTHEIETVFDLVRSGKMRVSDKLVSLTLRARDHIKKMLSPPPRDEALLETISQAIIDFFKQLLAEANSTEEGSPPQDSPILPPHEGRASSINKENAQVTYRIRFVPGEDLFKTGSNPVLLLGELHELGACRVVAHLDRIPSLNEMDPESCYVYFDVILTTDKGIESIKDVFIFVEGSCELQVTVIDEGGSLEDEGEYKKLGQILVEKGDLSAEDLAGILKEKKLLGEMLVEKGLVSEEKVLSALAEQDQVRIAREAIQAKEEGVTSIRVPAEKLDVLVNLVGELVTVQARLAQMTAGMENAEFASVSEEIERLTADLRDNTLNIRMLPIGTTFGRFKRLVRDLSKELGKEIELVTEGAETELDKTVIEKLNDPLVHIIRNSIDHGIEAPGEREAAGKPRIGTIRLSAVHSGANVLITISDDGKGLDSSAIRAKAIEKGLMAAGQETSEKDLFGMIFMAGFSTAKAVTNVSGRGVGMDVVKRSIDALRGTIEVESAPGQGTTVTVRLPLTLAIIEGLLVGVGESSYILPLAVVEECVELTREDVKRSNGRNLAPIRGELVPYIRLRNEFGVDGEAPCIEQIVVAGINGSRVGFVVDKVIGEHQTVIKSLGKLYKNVEGISGATILGDGSVALIVDVGKVTAIAEANEMKEMAR